MGGSHMLWRGLFPCAGGVLVGSCAGPSTTWVDVATSVGLGGWIACWDVRVFFLARPLMVSWGACCKTQVPFCRQGAVVRYGVCLAYVCLAVCVSVCVGVFVFVWACVRAYVPLSSLMQWLHSLHVLT